MLLSWANKRGVLALTWSVLLWGHSFWIWCVCIQLPLYNWTHWTWGKRTLLVLCVLSGTTVVSVLLEHKQTKPYDIQVVCEIEPEEILWFQWPKPANDFNSFELWTVGSAKMRECDCWYFSLGPAILEDVLIEVFRTLYTQCKAELELQTEPSFNKDHTQLSR